MCTGLGLAQDLVEGLGWLSHSLGLQQDLVPGLGRYTYPGCLGLGCDYLSLFLLSDGARKGDR